MKRIYLFIAVLFLYQALSETLYSQCCFSGWSYRALVSVVNNNPAQVNFEISDTINTQALISGGKMKNDASDLRFSDSLCNNIPYWIESGVNTATTVIWYKIANLPANSVKTIYMYYGNPSATALSNPQSVFKFFEGFDGSAVEQFTIPCGTGTATVSGGTLAMSWASSFAFTSDTVFPSGEIYTAEMKVNASTGNWPVFMWTKQDANNRSYGILVQNSTSTVRIGKSGSSVGYCQGQNFTASGSFTSPVGIWSATWAATGDVRATFPTVSPLQTTDSEHPRDANLKLTFGGISSGSGAITIDWVRARKWVAGTQPFGSTIGAEQTFPAAPSALIATAVSGLKINLSWSDNSSNEDKFYIQRSTNGGSNWSAKDSVNTGVTAYTDSLLTGGQIYCYRVNAGNCRGISGYTATACDTAFSVVSISGNNTVIPKVFAVYQNYPNPFNPVTNIKFDIPHSSYVSITIYDALGKEVTKLINGQLEAGTYTANWDASGIASGIYFYRIEAGDHSQGSGQGIIKEMKMVVLK